jgi:hypothetical protein
MDDDDDTSSYSLVFETTSKVLDIFDNNHFPLEESRESPKKNQSQDYRFGRYAYSLTLISRLQIESISPMDFPTLPVSKPHVTSLLFFLTRVKISTTTGKFVPFSSTTSSLESGILHLYRDTLPPSSIPSHSSSHSPPCKSLVLACLAVPSYISPRDWIEFIEPVLPLISHIRTIRDSFPSRYMVLLKFREQADVDMVYAEYNGRAFNSMEAGQVCHLVYISSVEFLSTAIPPYLFR